jgi:hypothetical protein
MKHAKFILSTALIGALVLPLTVLGAEGEWFDLENCAMCKNLSAEEGLMDHVEWETHLINNGMLSVTMVDPDYQQAFKRAMVNMQETSKKLMSGQQLHLCGFCNSHGALYRAGATMEDVKTDVGLISLITASDTKTVEMIHQHAKRTIDEYEKLKAAEKDPAQHGHW